MRTLNMSLVLMLGIGVWSGCSKDGAGEPQPAASEGSEAPPVPATGTVPMTKLTDGQIAQILAAVDEAEIEQAQLALEKSTDAGVRGYASHMIEQHTAAKETGARLASQSGLQLAESPKAKELQVKGSQMLEQLKAADAKNFDITYLHAQADQHAEVLALITDQLQPAVSDATLRDHLANARAMVTQHLDKAKELQK
jgi:putative membrane protein